MSKGQENVRGAIPTRKTTPMLQPVQSPDPMSDPAVRAPAAAPTLGYGTPATGRPRRRLFYAWALPLLWLPASVGSCFYYGDEYSAFGAANLLVVLVLDRMGAFNHFDRELAFALAVAGGAALLALVGLAMDVLRVSRRALLGMIAVVIAATVFGVVSITPKWRAAGEASDIFLTMFFVGWSWGVHALAAAALAVTPVARLVRRR